MENSGSVCGRKFGYIESYKEVVEGERKGSQDVKRREGFYCKGWEDRRRNNDGGGEKRNKGRKEQRKAVEGYKGKKRRQKANRVN